MRPYYEEAGVQIYCADARDLVGQLEAECIITDPVWPNCEHVFPGIEAKSLLRDVLELTAPAVSRVVVHLGCQSDPRFLSIVPSRWAYVRTCYLEFAAVSYLGRILHDANVAYVFGVPPASKEGAHVLPGRVIATRDNTAAPRGWGQHRDRDYGANLDLLKHPARRHIQHVRWLCKWLGGASVLDPFMGSGTTAVACKALGIPFIGVEIEPRYCDLAVSRLAQGSLDLAGASA